MLPWSEYSAGGTWDWDRPRHTDVDRRPASRGAPELRLAAIRTLAINFVLPPSSPFSFAPRRAQIFCPGWVPHAPRPRRLRGPMARTNAGSPMKTGPLMSTTLGGAVPTLAERQAALTDSIRGEKMFFSYRGSRCLDLQRWRGAFRRKVRAGDYRGQDPLHQGAGLLRGRPDEVRWYGAHMRWFNLVTAGIRRIWERIGDRLFPLASGAGMIGSSLTES